MDCRHLRDEVANMLNRENLQEFLSERARNNFERVGHVEGKSASNPPPHAINKIFGGSVIASTSFTAAKKMKISVNREKRIRELPDEVTITFSYEDAADITIPHNDALVITVFIDCFQDENYIYSYIWANDKVVQKELNVREGITLERVRCNKSTHYRDYMKRTESYVYVVLSVIDDHWHLTSKSRRALIYSGDHDMVVPHLSTKECIDTLKLPIIDDSEPWFVDGQAAGYKVKYNDYELTYATVKGAGHTPPEYKPEQCLPMAISCFAVTLFSFILTGH
ncbi:serine carboxypeptidase-like 7 [Lycium barbarum]|uniref:serine carboxypeptidase-like 7 n=1 Tax=Lycium barbarum TaxID=112863 RepID=UPI00293E684D|nr:serine carboxypeptidase-like 7 [Lycium barbarum]